jgi:PKD repeat protein
MVAFPSFIDPFTSNRSNMKKFTYTLFLALPLLWANGLHAQVYINHIVNQPSQLVVMVGDTFNICTGDSVQIGGNPTATGGTAPYAYAWSPSNGLSSTSVANPMASPTGTTPYALQLTDANGCTSNSGDLVQILQNPTANFTFTANLLSVAFTDQSTNGTGWLWDFGDGQTSTLPSPTHTYAADGNYVVCLTVNPGTNCFASFCDTINVNSVGLVAAQDAHIAVYPNPASGNEVNFDVDAAGIESLIQIDWFDLQGKRVLHYEGASSQKVHTLSRKGLAAGSYQYRITSGEMLLGTGKVVLR